jgi:hypothetical protein
MAVSAPLFGCLQDWGSSEEDGAVEPDDGSTVMYKLQRTESGFTLQIFVKTAGGDARMINTRVVSFLDDCGDRGVRPI